MCEDLEKKKKFRSMEHWKTGGILSVFQLSLFFKLAILFDTDTWSEVILLSVFKNAVTVNKSNMWKHISFLV